MGRDSRRLGLGGLHGFLAIAADDVDGLGGSYGVAATWADIFPGAGGLGLFGVLGGPGAVCGQLAVPMLAGAEGTEFLCGLGDAPADALIVFDGQAPLFRFLLEAAIMVGAVCLLYTSPSPRDR